MRLSSSRLILSAFAVSFALYSCNNQPKETKPVEEKPMEYLGVNTALMDQSAIPCEDFFTYCNGTWVKENPVPDTESRWSSFNEVTERNNKILKHILDSALSANAEKGSNLQKIGDFYYCAMDSNKLEADGIAPIQSYLDKINALEDGGLEELIAGMHKMGLRGGFGSYVGQDDKNSEQYITFLMQSGLGLPDRDFYFRSDARSQEIREKYLAYIQNVFTILGKEDAEAQGIAQRIMDMETALADKSLTNVERRDVEKTYNKFSIEDLQTHTPDFNWSEYFTGRGAPAISEVVVSSPEFLTEFNRQATATPLSTWKEYLTWHLLKSTSSRLNKALSDASFNFYRGVLRGTKVQKPRWKRALGDINSMIGEVLGQEFVKMTFSEDTKERLDGMVDNLEVAFSERLAELDWMSAETKEAAIKKLGSFSRKLGYPDKWKDHSNLDITRESYVSNYMACMAWSVDRNMSKLGKPIDRTEWGMAPQIVNAYYNPPMNEIVFPAGILQPPFLDPTRDDASLYAGIGSVIGHELTHGFDDQGSQYDGEGNLNDWWTESDRTNFEERSQKVVEQFNSYEALDSLYVNGNLTLGENIADLGGVAMAFNAYMKSLEGKERKDIDGFSPEQRFFISYAQIWRGNYTDQAMEQQVRTNPHAPNKFRVLGPLSNIPEFHAAFACKEGDNMVRPDSLRAIIW